MKVALVFSGQPRYIDEMIIFQLNNMFFLNKYDCDVYAHFWFKQDENYIYNTGPDSYLSDLKLHKDSITLFTELYKPKKIVTEDPPTLEDLTTRHYTHVYTQSQVLPILSYTTSLKKAYNLIDNPEQYDFIIRLRTDMLLIRCPDLNTLSKENIYLCSVKLDELYIYDCFFIASPNHAKSLCYEIDNIDAMYDKGEKMAAGEMFMRNIQLNNLLDKCRILPFKDFYFRIQRQGKSVHSMIGLVDEKPE